MSVLGLHLHDAALAAARDGEPQGDAAPSIVHADPADPRRLGLPAADAARRAPHRVSHGHWSALWSGDETAALAALPMVRAELRRRVAPRLAPGDALQVAVPAPFDAAALAWVLAACRAESLPVAGFHDAAALAVAALGLEGAVLVPSIGLSHIAVTRVQAIDGEARRRAARVVRDTGLLQAQQRWLELVAEAMVLRSRFDPLHEAASEQRLYDLLPAAASRAALEGSATLELPTGTGSSAVTLSRDQFAAAARPLARGLAALVESLRPDGQPVSILLTESALGLPGIAAALGGMPGLRLVAMDDTLVARAASLQATAAAVDDAAVTLHRGAASGTPLAAPRMVEVEGGPVRAAPTHVLWRGEAIPLSVDTVLEVGRAPAPGGIRLDEGLAGVSRLHCSLRRGADGLQVIDHAAHGTFLNGHRIAGRARLAAGDRLRIGDPGVELAFIAVGAGGGADAGTA